MMTVTERRNEDMLNRVDELNGLLQEGEKTFKIIARNCFKNNGSKVGYTLYSEEYNAAPTVYFEHMEDFWESSTEVVSYLEAVFNKSHLDNVNFGRVMTRDYILSHVKPKLISQDNISDVKSGNIAYCRYLDMLILFAVEIDEISDKDGVATCTIQNPMLHTHDISIEELYRHAKENIANDYTVTDINEIICEMIGFPDKVDARPIGTDTLMWVVTNKKKINGASSILNKKALTELSEKFEDGEYIIIPSSIHECIAVPSKDTDPTYLKALVREVNDTEVSADEILTYNVYLYKNGELSIFN